VITASVFGLIGCVVQIAIPYGVRVDLWGGILIGVAVSMIWGKTANISSFAVPAAWIAAGGKRAAAVWGTILGLGVLTFSGPLMLAYLAGLALVADWWQAILVGILFGLARSVLPLPRKIRRYISSMAKYKIGSTTVLTYTSRSLSMLVLLSAILAILKRQ